MSNIGDQSTHRKLHIAKFAINKDKYFKSTRKIVQILDLLLSYFESKQLKDQMILLLAEPRCIDLIYCVLLEETVDLETRAKIYKLIFALLKTTKISNRHKARIRIHVETHFEAQQICPLCSQVCKSRESLRKHLTRRHGDSSSLKHT